MMDPVDDLVVWLRRQLDTDEAMARNAFGPHNDAVAEWSEIWSSVVQLGPEEELLYAVDDSQIARHIARHDPARVLREVEAKRRILDEHQRDPVLDWCSRCDVPADTKGLPHGCPTVRLLALPYCDRPGYQEAWRPA